MTTAKINWYNPSETIPFVFIKRTSHKIMLVANHITNVTHNQIPHKRSTPNYKCLNFT